MHLVEVTGAPRTHANRPPHPARRRIDPEEAAERGARGGFVRPGARYVVVERDVRRRGVAGGGVDVAAAFADADLASMRESGMGRYC